MAQLYIYDGALAINYFCSKSLLWMSDMVLNTPEST